MAIGQGTEGEAAHGLPTMQRQGGVHSLLLIMVVHPMVIGAGMDGHGMAHHGSSHRVGESQIMVRTAQAWRRPWGLKPTL